VSTSRFLSRLVSDFGFFRELLRHMSAKQVEQFEAYRRSGLKAAAVRKVSMLWVMCDHH
jgi:hypothetical protein